MTLVTQWLSTHKFKRWETHSSTGNPVSKEEREQRARQIAERLCDHQAWLSHGRPIKIPELRAMRLQVTDYGEDSELQGLVWSLWVNLFHFMSATNIYKVFESESTEVWNFATSVAAAPSTPPSTPPLPGGRVAGKAVTTIKCLKCNTENKVQANFGAPLPIDAEAIPFPRDAKLNCRGCGNLIDLTGLKAQLEAKFKQPLTFSST
jgi:hypothetical protein